MSESVERIRTIVENYKSLIVSHREIKYICQGERDVNHEYFKIIKSPKDRDLGMCLKTVLHREGISDEIQNSIFERTLRIKKLNRDNNKLFFINIFDDYSVNINIEVDL